MHSYISIISFILSKQHSKHQLQCFLPLIFFLIIIEKKIIPDNKKLKFSIFYYFSQFLIFINFSLLLNIYYFYSTMKINIDQWSKL